MTPTTRTGKALLNAFHFPGGDAIVAGQYVSWHLAAIEAEAREQGARAERERLRRVHEKWEHNEHTPPNPKVCKECKALADPHPLDALRREGVL